MVKTKFKKAVSLMLAAVMSLTAFMGIGATTAFAAVGEKADVYLVDYPRSGDTNNNGEWGHGNLNYMNGWKFGQYRLLYRAGYRSADRRYSHRKGRELLQQHQSERYDFRR